jgi:hypothetical protein
MSTAASSIPDRPQPAVARLCAAMASRPLLPAFVLLALITIVRLSGTVDSDVAWQLWIANRMHAGADLYRDIIETNPPLWFWMGLPIDGLATFLHVRSEAVLIITMGTAAAFSLVATNRLTGHIEAGRRTALLAYGALALAAIQWMHVGQREQIVLIGSVPYAALIAARREERHVSAFLSAAVGVAAALGFALKHYFLIVPILLELWLLAGQRRGWRPIRPETVAVATIGIAYAAAILLFERDFLTTIIPLIQLAYGAFGPPSVRYLFGPFALVGLAILALFIANWRLLLGRRAPFASALLVAALGFTVAYFIQFKGWYYHSIPLLGCGSLGLAALLAESSAPARLLRLVAPAALSLPFFLSAQEAFLPRLPGPDVLDAASILGPGDTVGFITTEAAIPWSITLQRHFRYASRYNGYWMMSAIVRNELLGSPDARLTRLGHQIVSETVADFRCAAPKRIIVTRPRIGEDEFDILAFFLRDPEFRALLSHYRVRSRTSVETFELVSTPVPAANCRTGV